MGVQKRFDRKLIAVLISVSMVVGGLPFGFFTPAYAATDVSTWDQLETAVAAGGEINITADIFADGRTLTIPSGKTVTLKGNITIYRGVKDSMDSLFKVESGATLNITDKVKLSGRGYTCSGASVTQVEGVVTKKEPTGVSQDLDDYKKTTTTSAKITAPFTIKNPGQGSVAGYEFEPGGTTELKINSNGYLYSESHSNMIIIYDRRTKSGLDLKNGPTDTYAVVLKDKDGNTVTTVEESKTYSLYETRWNSGGYIFHNGSKYDNDNTAGPTADKNVKVTVSGGQTTTYWEIPDENGNLVPYTDPDDAQDALTAYINRLTTWKVSRKGDDTIYEDGLTETEANSKKTQWPYAYWSVEGDDTKYETEQEAKDSAGQGDCTVQGCDGDTVINSGKFTGTEDNPKGFFIHVESGGTANLDGASGDDTASIENLITDESVKWAAPVVANGGTFNITKGKIQNNIVGYNIDDSHNNNTEFQIEKEVEKTLSPTNTAGGVIYSNGAEGEISGGSIINNRGDAGGITVRSTDTRVDFTGGNIDKNVGVHYGGAAYVHMGGSLYMDGDATMDSNYSWDRGGAVYVSSQDYSTSTVWPVVKPNKYEKAVFVMEDGTISNNYSVNRGGGIYVESHDVMLLGGDIINNLCRSTGGGIYVVGDGDERMYQLYIPSGCITGNEAVNNNNDHKLDKILNPVSECDFTNTLKNDNAPAANSHQGFGGGLYLCAFGGNATFGTGTYGQDNKPANVIIDGNTAIRGQGQDMHLRPTQPGAGSAINVLHNYQSSGRWAFENSIPTKYVEANKVYPGPINVRNDADTQTCDGSLNISGNTARIGAGISSNGTVIFGPATDIYRLSARLEVEKEWLTASGQTDDIKLQLAVKDPDDGQVYELGDDYSIVLNGTTDKYNHEGDGETEDEYNDDSVVHEYEPWKATFGLPMTYTDGDGNLKPIMYFENTDKTVSGSDEDKLYPSNASDLEAIYKLLESGKITKAIPVAELVIEETIKGQKPTQYAYSQKDLEFLVDASKDDSEKLNTTTYVDRSKQTLATVDTYKLSLKFKKGVRNEEPEIEKYIDKAVHTDINLSDVFTYDIMAYITGDADKFVIKDKLVSDLEIVDEDSITVLDMGPENNHDVMYKVDGSDAPDKADATVGKKAGDKIGEHTVTDITDKADIVVTEFKDALTVTMEDYSEGEPTTNVRDLRGHWVKVTFKAQIKQSIQDEIAAGTKSIKDLKNVTIKADEKYKASPSIFDEDRPVPNVGNAPVDSDEDHNGIDNTAHYDIEAYNTAESEYEKKHEDESNTVTVKPTIPEVEKYVNEAVHKEIELDEIFKYDIIGYIPKDADKVVFEDELVDDLELVNVGDIKIVSLDENNHKPFNDINDKAIADNSDASVHADGNNIKEEDGVTIAAEEKGSALIVTIDDKVTCDDEGGVIDRQYNTVKNLRKKWVRITFYAQIKKDLQEEIKAGTKTISDLKNVEIKDDENAPVLSEEAHNGIDNDATMKIQMGNKPEASYETNIVTVKPKLDRYPVFFSKKELGGDAISGAHIVLKDEEGNVVAEWDSTKDSRKVELKPGKYKMTETVAPEGFKRVTTVMEFEIDQYGKITLVTTEVDNDGKLSVSDTNHIILEDAPEKPILSIKKTSNVKKAKHGDIIPYVITVKNSGKGPAKGVTVVDTMGEGLSYVSDDNNGTVDGRKIEWTVDVPAGKTIDINIKCKVKETAKGNGDIVNSAELISEYEDDMKDGEDKYSVALDNPKKANDKNGKGKGSKTGDDFNTVFWITLLLLSLAGLSTPIILRRRRKE